jgi:hypothetical protein
LPPLPDGFCSHPPILPLLGPFPVRFGFFAYFQHVFRVRFGFVWVRFFDTFVDAKGLLGFVPYILTSFLECGSLLVLLRLELARGAAGSKLPAKESGSKLPHSKPNLATGSKLPAKESGSKLPHSKPNLASGAFWLKSRKMGRTFAAAPRENSVAGIAPALTSRGSRLTCITPASVSFEGRRGPQPRKIEQSLHQGPFR